MELPRVLLSDQQSYIEKCTYLGDRIHGITFAYQLARRANRTFCVRWHRDCPLETFLSQREVDWTCKHVKLFKNSSVVNMARLYTFHGVNRSRTYDMVLQSVAPLVRVRANIRLPEKELRVTFWRLFEPTVFLQETARRIVHAVVDMRPYVAVHVRMGDGADGSGVRAAPWFRNDRRVNFTYAVDTLVRFVKYHDLLWVTTDNKKLRDYILYCRNSDLCGKVVAWNLTQHQEIAMRSPNTMQHATISFVEAMIFGSAQCIVGGVATDRTEGVN